MSNSKLVSIKVPADKTNYSDGRGDNKIEKVTIHHMAGILSAETCGNIFKEPNRKASSNYGIGKDGEIGLYVDEKNTSYADANFESNQKSVTIECSNSEKGGDWPVSDEVLQKLIELIADIFKRNKIKKAIKGKTITWHSMYSQTECPGDYLRSKMDYICEEVNKLLDIKEEEKEENVINRVTVTHSKGLNLRKEPNTESEILGAFEKGTTIELYEIKGNWGRTEKGWVCLDYTSYNVTSNKEETTNKKYTTGRYEVTAEVLTVRTSPEVKSDNWLRYSQLSTNAQGQIYKLCGYKPNGLCKRSKM